MCGWKGGGDGINSDPGQKKSERVAGGTGCSCCPIRLARGSAHAILPLLLAKLSTSAAAACRRFYVGAYVILRRALNPRKDGVSYTFGDPIPHEPHLHPV